MKENLDNVITKNRIHARLISFTTEQFNTLQRNKDLLSFWKWEVNVHAKRVTIRVACCSIHDVKAIPLIDGFALKTDDLKEYLNGITGEAVHPEEYVRFAPPAVRRLLAQRVGGFLGDND